MLRKDSGSSTQGHIESQKLKEKLELIANIVATSKALVTRSDARVTTSLLFLF